MIDRQSLSDLNILPDVLHPASLLQRIDYCRTNGGKEALRRLLKLEHATYTDISSRQETVRYIVGSLEKWRLPIEENDIFYVQEYLKAVIDTNEERTSPLGLASLYMRTILFSKAQYYTMLSGVKGTLQLLHCIDQLSAAVYGPAMPDPLRQKFLLIRHYTEQLGITPDTYTAFLGQTPSPLQILRTDQTLRLKHATAIHLILDVYYELEALWSLASAHRALNLCFPEIHPEMEGMVLKDLRHPLMNNCVPNTIDTRGKSMMIITGANMSGKSTVMKSIGTAFVMAYLGMGVAASAGVLPVVERIMTYIDIRDDVEKGYSYFLSEVKRVRGIAAEISASRRVLVICDELFKGTNVQDALECNALVIEGFLQHPDNFYFIATHYTEIAEQFSTQDRCLPACFQGEVLPEEIRFDYQLKPGISRQRIGANILRREGVPALFAREG